jgi:hypothetical protein
MFAGAWCIAMGVAQIRHYGLRGEEILEPDQFERSAKWVGNGQLTLEDHEALVGYALNGQGQIPTSLVAARKLAMSIRNPDWLAGPVTPPEPEPVKRRKEPEEDEPSLEQLKLERQRVERPIVPPERLPKLPVGYFDGYLSADEPENSINWAEVRRGDGTTYWIRSR